MQNFILASFVHHFNSLPLFFHFFHTRLIQIFSFLEHQQLNKKYQLKLTEVQHST